MVQSRSLTFDGAKNFRDLGGYAAGKGRVTCWNRVYRSDSLSELTDADLDQLKELGLFGICDYRITEEAGKKPDRLPDHHDIQVINPGFLPANTLEMLARISAGTLDAEGIKKEVVGHYTDFARLHIVNYVPFFQMLLEADGRPVLIHCTSGKDRTGWGSALAMLAAGCPEDVVIEDYLLSNRFRRDIGFMFPDGIQQGVLDMLTSVQPVYIATALAELRLIHGPGDQWMGELGFQQADRARLRELLSEPAN